MSLSLDKGDSIVFQRALDTLSDRRIPECLQHLDYAESCGADADQCSAYRPHRLWDGQLFPVGGWSSDVCTVWATPSSFFGTFSEYGAKPPR